MMFLILNLLSIFVVFSTVLLATAKQRRLNPLGVRVPRDYLDAPEVQAAHRRYILHNVLYAVSLIVVTVLSLRLETVQILIASLSWFGFIALYIVNRQQLLKTKEEQRWFDNVETRLTGSVSTVDDTALWQAMDMPKPKGTVHHPVYAATIVLQLLAMALVWSRWEEIPDVVAIHWGSDGADAWAEKGVFSIFQLGIVGIGLSVLLWGVGALIVKSKGGIRSSAGVEKYVRGQVETSVTGAAMAAIAWLCGLLMATLQVISVLPDFSHHMEGNLPLLLVVIFMAAVLFFCAWAFHTSQQAQDRLRTCIREGKIDAAFDVEAPDNDRFYKLGMFYYNPDDPAVMVDKRFGVGVDFNYAHWQGKAFIVTMLLITCGVIGLLLAL